MFCMAPAQQPLKRQIRLVAELDNALNQLIGMRLLLSHMLEKLRLYVARTGPGGHEIMAFVAEDADNFRG
jgi:hypothetical protein